MSCWHYGSIFAASEPAAYVEDSLMYADTKSNRDYYHGQRPALTHT
jgi:hypothetical protein